MNIIIEEMKAEHWPAVKRIYLEGIQTGQATFEQEAPLWEDWDGKHIQTCRLVTKVDNEVVGWAALSPISSRCVYKGVAEVSVYVGSQYRGLGIGRHLMKTVIETSENEGYWTLQSSIFPENQASLSLHLNFGFREI